jgi:hypothetical protein
LGQRHSTPALDAFDQFLIMKININLNNNLKYFSHNQVKKIPEAIHFENSRDLTNGLWKDSDEVPQLFIDLFHTSIN